MFSLLKSLYKWAANSIRIFAKQLQGEETEFDMVASNTVVTKEKRQLLSGNSKVNYSFFLP